MKINQINLTHNPLEDRLLFRLNTHDKTEFRMWLTRAMSIKLLGLLDQAVNINLGHERRDLGQPAIQAVTEFRREAVLAEADYKTDFVSTGAVYPLGEQPILVTDIVLDSAQPSPALGFQLAIQQVVNLSLDYELGLSISKLLTDVLNGVSWGIGVSQDSTAFGPGGHDMKLVVH